MSSYSRSTPIYHSVKCENAIEGAFNQEKALLCDCEKWKLRRWLVAALIITPFQQKVLNCPNWWLCLHPGIMVLWWWCSEVVQNMWLKIIYDAIKLNKFSFYRTCSGSVLVLSADIRRGSQKKVPIVSRESLLLETMNKGKYKKHNFGT